MAESVADDPKLALLWDTPQDAQPAAKVELPTKLQLRDPACRVPSRYTRVRMRPGSAAIVAAAGELDRVLAMYETANAQASWKLVQLHVSVGAKD